MLFRYKYKFGECIWCVIILDERKNIDISEALEKFLSKTDNHLSD